MIANEFTSHESPNSQNRTIRQKQWAALMI